MVESTSAADVPDDGSSRGLDEWTGIRVENEGWPKVGVARCQTGHVLRHSKQDVRIAV